MCDYSLMHVASRPAKVADKLVSTAFKSSMSRGFCAQEDPATAVCILPGTELKFEQDITVSAYSWMLPVDKVLPYRTARFRQINKEVIHAHHDALELPDGTLVLVTCLKQGQQATILQLPAEPKNEIEAQEQKRLESVA
jgi:hypothetical protein